MEEQEFERIGVEWLESDAARRAELELQYPWILACVGRNWGTHQRERENIAHMLDEIDTMIVDKAPHHRIHGKYWAMSRYILGFLGKLG